MITVHLLRQGAVEYVRFSPSTEGILDQCPTANQGKYTSYLSVIGNSTSLRIERKKSENSDCFWFGHDVGTPEDGSEQLAAYTVFFLKL